jgi:hypothetical protein
MAYSFVTLDRDPVHVYWKRTSDGQLCARIRKDLLTSLMRDAPHFVDKTTVFDKIGDMRKERDELTEVQKRLGAFVLGDILQRANAQQPSTSTPAERSGNENGS